LNEAVYESSKRMEEALLFWEKDMYMFLLRILTYFEHVAPRIEMLIL